jgi:hypothetical protein
MPNLEEVLERFKTWRANSARVQVTWEGLGGNQRFLTADLDGIVRVIETETGGARTLVVVGGGGNNRIHMYLTEGCNFQTATVGSDDPANIADIASMIRMVFPTGEICFVTFYHPLN